MAKLLGRSGSSPIERDLRACRPAAPAELVQAIASHTRGRAGAVGLRVSPRRTAVALAATAAVGVVFLGFGGMSYAASAASQVAAAVKVATSVATSSATKGIKGGGGGDPLTRFS